MTEASISSVFPLLVQLLQKVHYRKYGCINRQKLVNTPMSTTVKAFTDTIYFDGSEHARHLCAQVVTKHRQ